MTRTIYYTATSLDGFLATPDDSLEWLFEQDHDPDGPMSPTAFDESVGALAMGATTYRWIVEHEASDGRAWPYRQPTWVFTHRSQPSIAGADVRFTQDPVAEVHAAMAAAAGGRDLWVMGGGDLAAQFARAGLLDEIVVSIAAVTLGAGRPLFTGAFDLELEELARNRAFVCARYRVVGPRPEDGGSEDGA